MAMRKHNFSNHYRDRSVSQGFSNKYIKEPSFSSNKNERIQDDKCKDLESQEVICRDKNGLIFCNACNLSLKIGSSSNLKQHLKGTPHKFSLQNYKDTSKEAILVKEAINQKILKHASGTLNEFYCWPCHLNIEYKCLGLLAGHLLNAEHQANLDPNVLQPSSSAGMEIKMEVEDVSFDQLTVVGCTLCMSEICALNIEKHISSPRHFSKVVELKRENTNQLELPKSKNMEPDEAIECGIVKLTDVMTYFCNACDNLLTKDGTLNPLKNHLGSQYHKQRTALPDTITSTFPEKNRVKQEIKDGILKFRFKASEVKPKDSKKAVSTNPDSFQDTMNQQNVKLQGSESIYIVKDKKLGSHQLDPNTEVLFRRIPPSRVIHVSILKNLDDIAPFDNKKQIKRLNKRLIDMASPYGKVKCVKILELLKGKGTEKFLRPKALLEMVDLAAAKNLINNFSNDKKNFETITLEYSEHKFLKSGHRPVPKMFTGTKNKPLGREIHCPVSQRNFSGDNNEPLDHEIRRPVSQKDFSGANNEPLGHEIRRPISHKDFSGANNEPLGHEIRRPISQKDFSGVNNKPFGHEIRRPVSHKDFSGANNEPLGHEIHCPVSQKNFSGFNNEPLGRDIQSDHRHTSQMSYDRTEHIPAYQPWGGNHKESSKTIIDYGHKVIDYGHRTSYTSPIPNLTPHVPYQSKVPGSSPFPCPLVGPSVTSTGECNISDDYKRAPIMLRKSDNFGAQNILASSSMQSMSEPPQPESIRKTISSDITQSYDLSSGTAAELNDLMTSMSAEQRKMWEQKLGESVKSMEQEIDEDEDFVNPSVVTTNSEWGESRKRKYHNEEQERNYSVDLASRETSVYSNNRYGCSSNDGETSYWSKRRKETIEVEHDNRNPHDESKYNIYAKGTVIKRRTF